MAVGRINPEDPASPDHMSMWTEEHGLHGMRLSPSRDAAGDWFKGPGMDPIFARAQDLRDPDVDPDRSEPDAGFGADPRPATRMWIAAFDHMADAHPDNPEERQWLMDMARYPHVYVKISHTWSISQQGYPWADTHAMVEEVYQAFGPQRIMWGTDWPVCLSKARYDQALTVVRDEMKFHRAGGSGVGAGQDGVEAVEFWGRVRC